MNGDERTYPEKKYIRGQPRQPNSENKPDMRIVQSEMSSDGNEVENRNVGAIWKNKDKSGKEYLAIRLGQLRLVGFVPKGESKDGKEMPAYNVCMNIVKKNDTGKLVGELSSVGALWRNKSGKGVDYLTLDIGGKVKLGVFDNKE